MRPPTRTGFVDIPLCPYHSNLAEKMFPNIWRVPLVRFY